MSWRLRLLFRGAVTLLGVRRPFPSEGDILGTERRSTSVSSLRSSHSSPSIFPTVSLVSASASASASASTAAGCEQSAASPCRWPVCERSARRGGKGRESGRGWESRVAEEAEGRGGEEGSTPRAEGEKSSKRGASAKPNSPSAVGGSGKQRDRESHIGTPRGYAEMATVLSEVQLPTNKQAWEA